MSMDYSGSCKSKRVTGTFLWFKAYRWWLGTILSAVLGYGLAVYLGVLPHAFRLKSERCVQKLGCFSLDGDFALRPFSVVPEHPDDIGTTFIFYKDLLHSEDYEFDDIESLPKLLTPDKNLTLAVHGWLSWRDEPDIKIMAETLVKLLPTSHVILVEWAAGASAAYHQSVANTRIVGAQIAYLINHPNMMILPQDIHIVGISLGAHIAGYTGSLVKGLGRISGLDAAGPLFEDYPPSVRLDPSDAIFVDAIHTDGDEIWNVVLAEGGLGIHHPIGHADFYPNGGHSQPFCEDVLLKTLSDLTVTGFSDMELRKMVACDHELSLDYFLLSLNGTQYHSFQCIGGHDGMMLGTCYSTNYMGYLAMRPEQPTQYYLHTTNQHPFKGFHYVIVISSIQALSDDHSSETVYLNITELVGSIKQSKPLVDRALSTVHQNLTAMVFSPTPLGVLHAVSFTHVRSPVLVQLSVAHQEKMFYGCGELNVDESRLAVTERPCSLI